MHRPSRRVVAALGAVSAFMVAAPSAVADPASLSGNASCVGAGSSALAPGQGFGFPGERAGVSHFLKSSGGPPGQIASGFAGQHGTADECFPNGVPGE
jgi:hypothetical protein